VTTKEMAEVPKEGYAMAQKDKRILDPVLPDQGGRMMPVDPLGINAAGGGGPEEGVQNLSARKRKWQCAAGLGRGGTRAAEITVSA